MCGDRLSLSLFLFHTRSLIVSKAKKNYQLVSVGSLSSSSAVVRSVMVVLDASW